MFVQPRFHRGPPPVGQQSPFPVSSRSRLPFARRPRNLLPLLDQVFFSDQTLADVVLSEAVLPHRLGISTMQVPCPYILSRFIRVTLRYTSKFRSIWYNLIYRGTPPETDRVYRNVSQGLRNYSNSSTVGFEPQTYCMAV